MSCLSSLLSFLALSFVKSQDCGQYAVVNKYSPGAETFFDGTIPLNQCRNGYTPPDAYISNMFRCDETQTKLIASVWPTKDCTGIHINSTMAFVGSLVCGGKDCSVMNRFYKKKKPNFFNFFWF